MEGGTKRKGGPSVGFIALPNDVPERTVSAKERHPDDDRWVLTVRSSGELTELPTTGLLRDLHTHDRWEITCRGIAEVDHGGGAGTWTLVYDFGSSKRLRPSRMFPLTTKALWVTGFISNYMQLVACALGDSNGTLVVRSLCEPSRGEFRSMVTLFLDDSFSMSLGLPAKEKLTRLLYHMKDCPRSSSTSRTFLQAVLGRVGYRKLETTLSMDEEGLDEIEPGSWRTVPITDRPKKPAASGGPALVTDSSDAESALSVGETSLSDASFSGVEDRYSMRVMLLIDGDEHYLGTSFLKASDPPVKLRKFLAGSYSDFQAFIEHEPDNILLQEDDAINKFLPEPCACRVLFQEPAVYRVKRARRAPGPSDDA